MLIFLSITAVLEILFGIAIFAGSKSAIHEILGTLMMGFGVLTIALAAILAELRKAQPSKLSKESIPREARLKEPLSGSDPWKSQS